MLLDAGLQAVIRRCVWMLGRNSKQPFGRAATSCHTPWRAFRSSVCCAQQSPVGKVAVTVTAPRSTDTAAGPATTHINARTEYWAAPQAVAQTMVASCNGLTVLSCNAACLPTPAAAVATSSTAMVRAAGDSALHHRSLQQQAPCAQTTQLLVLDPLQLPPVTVPDAAAVHQFLSGANSPELSRESCPHLYYSTSVQQGCVGTQGVRPSNNSCSSSVQQSNSALQLAAQLLHQDLPVAMPTETVYGLAGNALSAAAVSCIFEAKGRPSDNPLIVHVSDLDMLYQLYPEHLAAGTNPIPQQYHRLIAAFWPGPLTILLPSSPVIPTVVTAGQSTVAVRMPAHPVARALIAAAGVPLAAPSANTSGKPSPTTAQHVMEDLSGRIPAVVDGGACGFGVESTVLDGLRLPPVVLRPGGVTAEQLAESPEMAGLQVYSRDFTDKALEANPTTPGMKYRHYSPTAPVLLLDPTPAWQVLQEQHTGMSEQQKQQSSQQLEQTVVAETQKLLQRLQQQDQPQRVVLLSTCRSSRSGSHTDIRRGWTPSSLQHLPLDQGMQLAGAAADSVSHMNSCTGRPVSTTDSIGPIVLEYVLGSIHRPDEVAKELFAALRAADRVGCDVIVVQGVLPTNAGLAVMNRLQKAASQRHLVGFESG